MNKLLFCLLLIALSWVDSYGQNQITFRIDSLPPEGVLLDKGWKWHPGDNPAWAKTAFDDSNWAVIDPTQDINKLPQVRKAGIGWLRLRIRVDSSLRNKIVSIVSDQSVASEFYLDGRLIGSFGKISTDQKNVEAYNPIGMNTLHQVIHFNFLNGSDHLLAIRFGVQPIDRYRTVWYQVNSFLKVSLFLSDQTGNNLRVNASYEKKGEVDLANLDYFRLGLFFVLAILHLFIFFSYPIQKANLYFGLYCLFSFAIFIIQVTTEQYLRHINNFQFYAKIFWYLYFSIQILKLTAVYALFSRKKGIIYKLLVFCITIYTLADTNNLPVPYFVGIVLAIMIYFDIVRISIVAYKNKLNGSYLLFIGSCGYILFLSIYIIAIVKQLNPIILHFSFNACMLSIPISITLFLAREFAETARSLAVNLHEVQQLSAEKQQILASQNETLEKQVSQRTSELKQSLLDLKATQNQLIQKEKLASLGELTAGIAHEIQNPLNFVNNFAEVSVELAEELHQSVEEDDKPLSQELASDLRQNMQQIAHNGQRASNIVRAMLEHSSSSSGERQPTDLNALAEEYLKLAYHGFRAKHSAFTATLKTDFALDLPLVKVVAGDVGRVLLNLFNNALYAVHQRQQGESGDYEPTVWVSTRLLGQHVELRVVDNGLGIPAGIREKVFQPFFTTKPTGQGTGLGLSLSYDIITKGHGGEMWLESQEGQGSVFTVKLPISYSH